MTDQSQLNDQNLTDERGGPMADTTPVFSTGGLGLMKQLLELFRQLSKNRNGC